MTNSTNDLSVPERILMVATRLFYRQGYHSTGINQLIAESGVAKASFYSHFPGKEDVLVEYMRRMASNEINELRGACRLGANARERFFAPLNAIRPWFHETDYRGCPFQNIVAEAPTDNPQVIAVLRQHRENLKALVTELLWDLIREEPNLRRLDPPAVVASYLLVLEGAIALGVAYREPWPIEAAIRTMELSLSPSS